MILYHGSEKIVDVPLYGKGNSHNDYGRGFYCTESEALSPDELLIVDIIREGMKQNDERLR